MGAPTGEVDAQNRQKLSFKLGKMFPGATYCFQATLSQRRKLTEEEKLAVARALSHAARNLASAEPQKLDAECDALAALRKDEHTRKGIKPCQVAAAFNAELPSKLRTANLEDTTLGKTTTLHQALYLALLDGESSADLLTLLNGAFSTFDSARTGIDVGSKALAKAKKLVSGLSGQNRPLYDPIPEVTQVAVCGTVDHTKDPAKEVYKVICSTAKDRASFIKALHEQRIAIRLPGVRTSQLPGTAEAALKEFLDSQEQAEVVTVTGDEVFDRVDGLDPGKAQTEANRLKTANELVALLRPLERTPGWRDSKQLLSLADLRLLLAYVSRIANSLQARADARSLPTSMADTATFKAFVARFYSSVVYVGATESTVATEGTTEEAFPFYASLDIGASLLLFGDRATGFAQNFGVNFYPSRMDPAERLRGGRYVQKAFSLTLGITTTGTKTVPGGVVWPVPSATSF